MVDKNKVPSPKCEDMVQMLLSAWQNVPNNFPEVFKKLLVNHALDGSEDHLVSDKLFALIGNDMQKVRKELMETPAPAKLLVVVEQLIPPKGIRRNNLEGSELLDYVGDDPYLIDKGDDDTNLSDEISKESGSADENSIAEEQIEDTSTIELATVAQSKMIPSLVNVSDDPLINKDAKFLDAFQNVFETNETGVFLKPHLKKMKAALYEARRSVKKRIGEASSNTVLEQEDEGKISDNLENM